MVKILAVENDREVLSSIEKALEQKIKNEDWTLRLADNALAAKKCQRERFDLILLNVMEQFLDGFEILKSLHEKKKPTRVLLILDKFITSKKLIAIINNAGRVNGIIRKPFTIEEIKNEIEANLEKSTLYILRNPNKRRVGSLSKEEIITSLTKDCDDEKKHLYLAREICSFLPNQFLEQTSLLLREGNNETDFNSRRRKNS